MTSLIIVENPIIFLELAVGDRRVGRIVIELFAHLVPKTVDYFVNLCTAQESLNEGNVSGRLKGSTFGSILAGSLVQRNHYFDCCEANQKSAYCLSPTCAKNCGLKHDRVGCLSLENIGGHSNGCQLVVTLNQDSYLDKNHVIFGQAIEGVSALSSIDASMVDKNSVPLKPITVVDCGKLENFKQCEDGSTTTEYGNILDDTSSFKSAPSSKEKFECSNVKSEAIKSKKSNRGRKAALKPEVPNGEEISAPTTPHSDLNPANSLKRKRVSIPKSDEKSKEPSLSAPVIEKTIDCIEMGKYRMQAWFYSPYPKDCCVNRKLIICDRCLKYMRKKATRERHAEKCREKPLSGVKIYSERGLAVYRVDGTTERLFCENLCLLSKLFIEHKTLYFDVAPFTFYYLCVEDECGSHIVGYFSKEKVNWNSNNLSCILVFPPYQRNGYGKLLISLSYEITKKEGAVGTPEKPLSKYGKLSYRTYWCHALVDLFSKNRSIASIEDISKLTGIHKDDIVSTLKYMDLIRMWKGQLAVYIDEAIVAAARKKHASGRIRLAHPENFVAGNEAHAAEA